MTGGDGYRTESGQTLLETMWEELDGCMDDLMAEDSHEDPGIVRRQGYAQGVAWCIALLTHAPGDPDVGAIKVEAMERWESRQ